MVPFLSLKDVTALHEQEICEAVQRVVKGGWYLQGEENKRFEKHFAEFCGSKYAIGCANGLDALTLILRAYIELGVIKEGDEVVVPANTYIASILAITENRLKPVLIEPRYETLEIDDSLIESAITERTKAIMIVHLYGRNAYTDKIGELCRKHNLLLIQDCAQSHGVSADVPKDIKGACGYSFYPGKNLGALGDGGAVTTDDETVATAVRTLANYGSQMKYVFQYAGRNSRLDEIQAAVLDVKLKYLPEDNAHRQEIAHLYYNEIRNEKVKLPTLLPDTDNVYHLFPVFCKRRDELQQFLLEKGIQTLIHYPIPPHMQEAYSKAKWNAPKFNLPITEALAKEELSLPIGPTITVEEAKYVTNIINEF